MTTREVVLNGGSPWGFRLHGGADVNQPLRISRVNPGSKAALRGIREGDFITSINNQSTKDISNAEAHALLRNSGDTLKLGLNEDGSGSPKRRQYKTVHQETHSETVRKSSITSYTVTSSKTIETSNELQTAKVNGNTRNLNGDPPNTPAVPQRSPLSLSSSSSTSTYTSLTSPSGTDMADSTRSRRKRGRNNRKKAKVSVNRTEVIVEESSENCDSSESKEYRVESPHRVKSPEAKRPVKSRSLDDDDLVKIQELSEVSESEDKSECKAIVSEAESDVEREVTATMEDHQVQTGTLSTLSLNLELCTTEQVSLISPEEELTLRNFLEGLNLVNSPEDAFRQIHEVSTMESVKSRRARKRAAIEQYFSPMVQNPRFLDVISEETSDLSDREQPLTHHLKQGTPEPDVPQSRPPKTRRVVPNPTFLVGTKIIDVPAVTHEISTTRVPQSKAEVVFLEDSSNSTTPDPKSDDDEKGTNDDVLSSTHSSVPDLGESETVEETKQMKIVVKKNDVVVSESESLEKEKRWSEEDQVKNEVVLELTPPPTPSDVSPKNETANSVAELERRQLKSGEDAQTICNKSLLLETETIDNCKKIVLENKSLSDVTDFSSYATVKKPVEKIINIKVEKEYSSAQGQEPFVVKNVNILDFRPNLPEATKETLIHIDIEKDESSKSTKEKIVEVKIEKNQLAQDKAQLPLIQNISKKIEETKEKIDVVKKECKSTPIETQFSRKANNISEGAINVSSSTGKNERIIHVEIEHGHKLAQNKAHDDNLNKIEETKERVIDKEVQKECDFNTVKSKPDAEHRERIIPIHIETESATDDSHRNKPESCSIKSKINKEKLGSINTENISTYAKEQAQLSKVNRIVEHNVNRIYQKPDTSKEVIINIEVEKNCKPNESDISLNTSTTINNNCELKSVQSKEKKIDVKIESETATDKTEPAHFQKTSNTSELAKEKVVEIKTKNDKKFVLEPKIGSNSLKLAMPIERIIPVEIKNESDSGNDPVCKNTLEFNSKVTSKQSKSSNERIVHVQREYERETPLEISKPNFKDTFKKVEVVRTHELKSSPDIVKLDDMKPPIVVTPTSPSPFSKNMTSLQPEWRLDNSLRKTEDVTQSKETRIEVIKGNDLEDPSINIDKLLKEERETNSECATVEENCFGINQICGVPTVKCVVECKEEVHKNIGEESQLPKEESPTSQTELQRKSEPKESPSKEVETICSLRLPGSSLFYSNVLSPPAPSPSPSLSSGSSSRATSLCTVKNSSIADITSIKDEEPLLSTKAESPLTLRELCVNFLAKLPFGTDILQELADVSSSIEHLTHNLLSAPSTNLPAFMEKSKSDSVEIAAMSQQWVGLPTDEDPRLLVCLSPTQKSQLDNSKIVKDEAAKLLDLHEKFIYRSTYHDAVERQVKNEVEITAIKPDVSNRLLAIIRDAQEPKIRKFSTLPRNMDSARLKAKDLSEWLQLARNKTNNFDENNQNLGNAQRRNSLPQELFKQQMEYLQEKEREIQRELEILEQEKRSLEMSSRKFRPEDYHISKKGDFAETRKSRPVSMPVATEYFRQQMYEEYMDKIAAREERKQHKVIKGSQIETTPVIKSTTGIEDEFMNKVKLKQKLGKLNLGDDKTDDESDEKVPKHLQEFMDIAKIESDGVWSPGQNQDPRTEESSKPQPRESNNEPISPVWTPKSATSSPTVERKEFRPIKYESPVLSRKTFKSEEADSSESSKEPPWRVPDTSSDTGFILSSALEKRLPTSHSSPASGFNDFPTTRLPRAQNPTITLLQKAREGQLPKGALYIEQDQNLKKTQNEKPSFVGPGEILYKIKHEYTSESDSEKPRKMADLGPRKYEGIGPTTRDGMPLILRSEVKDANHSKWYKRMYDTIHKQRPHRDEFVTVRYKQKRGQYPYTSGYLSEPEPGAYDSDFTDYKYATLDRRRLREKDSEVASSTMPRSVPDRAGSSVIKHGHDPYKNQPGRIENYIPGHSSISEKEAKEWWDEVMDIFDGHLEQQKRAPQTKSFINQALKESGYESDSTLIFRRRDDTAQLFSPSEQKEAYKTIQKGGDIPLYGLRKPAPERPKESPRKYVENEVTIHYKTPVRQEIKEYLSEDELAYRQAEAMKKIYQEERRRKYLQVSKSLQELQDMNNRRHTDNFIPSQKSPIPLNRYDDLDDLAPPLKPRPRSPEPRLMARALYNFVGQTARELTFRKGDLIYVRRQVDKNWYEGELNAMVGLFPVNYVEIITYDTAKPTPRKSHEGQARAKYNFLAQSHLELSLAKGELVIITRRVDDNWFEGKIGGRKGIFPVSYVEVLIDPSDPPSPSAKPVASPAAHSLLLNGSAGGKESMGSHSYTPNISSNQLTSSYHAKPVQITGSYGSLNRGPKNPVSQALHIETQAEPIPYRALYKYLPQNDDELELLEGDTVYVLEKCDDGWYVGSSERTGAFGTFPGNYVEKI